MKYILNGREVTEEEFCAYQPESAIPLEAGDLVAATPTTGWPIHSRALGVHPRQVKQAEEAARKAGVPTEFLPDGRPVIRSNQHQREYAKSRGLVNLDSFI